MLKYFWTGRINRRRTVLMNHDEQPGNVGHGEGGPILHVSGAIALVAVVGTLYLMFGTFPMLNIISLAVSVSLAYRISSG